VEDAEVVDVALVVVELEVVVGAEPQPWSPGHRALEQSKVVELEVVVGAEPQPWSPGHRALEQSKVVLDEEVVRALELDEDVYAVVVDEVVEASVVDAVVEGWLRIEASVEVVVSELISVIGRAKAEPARANRAMLILACILTDY
jgi:hypothetical protein